MLYWVSATRVPLVAEEPGALVYWLNAEESAAVIAADKATLGVISEALE